MTTRTANLPSTAPARYLNPILWTTLTLGKKDKEQQLREYMWKTEQPCNPSRTLTPDSVTDYEYDYDNRLVEVSLPTNNDTVEYTYDATGRRLTKTVTNHVTEALSSPPSFKGGRGVQNPQPAEDTTLSPSTTNTDVTTYKYHYIGSQITEIEIDSIRNPGESQTVLRDEEVKIHLGANSQPISYEWVKHVGGNTTQATYYYHYDIHGNVLKVTDSSENVKITYTYDVLGKILTETNPDSILNFFTFRGASQTIWDSEVGMYYSGGYYRPDTGTSLQGTGAPVLTNPSSSAMIKTIAKANEANIQLKIHAIQSAATAGSSSGGSPGGFRPPAGPSDGIAHSGKQIPPRPPEPPMQNVIGDATVSSLSLIDPYDDPRNQPVYGPDTAGWYKARAEAKRLKEMSKGMYGPTYNPGDTDTGVIAVAVPIAAETGDSQPQPEAGSEEETANSAGDGLINGVWYPADSTAWDNQGQSQAMNAIDTGLPGGGEEIKPNDLGIILGIIGIVIGIKQWEAQQPWYKTMNYIDSYIRRHGSDDLKNRRKNMPEDSLACAYINQARDTTNFLLKKGVTLNRAAVEKHPKFAYYELGNYSDAELMTLVLSQAMIDYESKYGYGSVEKSPFGFYMFLYEHPEYSKFFEDLGSIFPYPLPNNNPKKVTLSFLDDPRPPPPVSGGSIPGEIVLPVMPNPKPPSS